MHDNSQGEKRLIPPRTEEQSKEEQDLDEALYDTFPASDPVPVIQKSEPTAPPRCEESDRKEKADEVKRK